MVEGVVPWSDLAYVAVQSVVYAWFFNNTGGSVLLVMLFHTMNNVISGGYFHAMFSGADWVRIGWLLVALWCAVALVVVLVNGPEHLSRKRAKRTLTPPEGPHNVSRSTCRSGYQLRRWSKEVVTAVTSQAEEMG
jgi:hypothetical protein